MYVVKYKFCGIERVLEFSKVDYAINVFDDLIFSSKISNWFSEVELIV